MEEKEILLNKIIKKEALNENEVIIDHFLLYLTNH